MHWEALMNLVSRCSFLLVALLACAAQTGTKDKPKDTDKVKLSAAEEKILELTNKTRADEKLPPLKTNAKLMKAARAHSENMARQKKMSHVLDDKGPDYRIKQVGYVSLGWGENVAVGRKQGVYGGEEAFMYWIKSKLHRQNILTRQFQEIGIGVARGDNGWFYYTQVFATPSKRLKAH
jgi:uncharacterized protein YkwD